MEEYPESELADDAQWMIDNMEIPIEEFIPADAPLWKPTASEQRFMACGGSLSGEPPYHCVNPCFKRYSPLTRQPEKREDNPFEN